MSIQPSSRLRPSTLGTSRMLVRYIFGPNAAEVTPVAAFTALARAEPIFSPVLVTLVLQNLVHEAGGTLDAPPRSHGRRCPSRGRRSTPGWRLRPVGRGCRASGADLTPVVNLSEAAV